MTAASVKATIDSLYRSRAAHDLDGCLAHFSPDAVWRIAGSPDASTIAISGRGTAELRQLLSTLITTWRWGHQDIDSITIQDDRAVVHFKLDAVFTPTGTPISTELVDIFTVRDGKLTSLVEFVDTARVAQLVRS